MKNSGSPERQKMFFKVSIFILAALLAALIGFALGSQVKNLTGRVDSAPTDDRAPSRPILADYGPAPEFSLTERNGASFSKEELLGSPWIANFIFTRCAGQCPLMNLKMRGLQSRLGAENGFRFVSFTVDPENDTPEVLSAYADRFGAEKGRWFFLTGPQAEIDRILGGFFLGPVEELAMHSLRFILVDGQGRIRGYYDSSDGAAMKQLLHDSDLILKETTGGKDRLPERDLSFQSHPEAAEGSRRISEILQPPSGASE